MESVDSKQTQNAILFRALLPARIFMTPAYGPDTRLSELKVTRGTGMVRGGSGGCRLELRSKRNQQAEGLRFLNRVAVAPRILALLKPCTIKMM